MDEKTVLPISIPSARIFFVVNPVSFDNRQKMEAVIAGIHHFFNGAGTPLKTTTDFAVHVSRFPRDAIGAIRRFADAAPYGAPLRVYAVGGDGILFDCLNGVMGLPNVELGIMPNGTGSSFYRFFGEKNRDAFNSLEAQVNASSVLVDVVRCGSNYALGYCLVGLEPLTDSGTRMIRENAFMNQFIPTFSRSLFINAMFLIGLINFDSFKQNYCLYVDNEDLSGVHFLIHVMNSPWYDSNVYFPEFDPTDGYLDVVASGDMSILKIFKTVNKYLSAMKKFNAINKYEAGIKDYTQYKNMVIHRRAKKVSIASEKPLTFNLDGELFYDKNLTIEIKPAAVRIIAPGAPGLEAGSRT